MAEAAIAAARFWEAVAASAEEEDELAEEGRGEEVFVDVVPWTACAVTDVGEAVAVCALGLRIAMIGGAACSSATAAPAYVSSQVQFPSSSSERKKKSELGEPTTASIPNATTMVPPGMSVAVCHAREGAETLWSLRNEVDQVQGEVLEAARLEGGVRMWTDATGERSRPTPP